MLKKDMIHFAYAVYKSVHYITWVSDQSVHLAKWMPAPENNCGAKHPEVAHFCCSLSYTAL